MNIPQNININYGIKSINNIPYGHKISLKKIKSGDFIFKYGQIIGISNKNIEPGEHVHSHNMGYSEFKREYIRTDIRNDINKSEKTEYFKGFKRNNGSSGTRNYIGLISTVNCSATVVKKISDKINNYLKDNNFDNIDGAVCLKHSSGCGMNTSGYAMNVFNRTIEGFKIHPNFGKVFVIGLGCECAQISLYNNDQEKRNIEYLNIQDEGGTNEIITKVTSKIINQLNEINSISRTNIPVSELTVALQCGGSDSYSGITANPALGVAADLLVKKGGSSILSETPEIYGAEHLLINRASSQETADKLIKRIEWWKHYTSINNSSMDNNPAPGNKKGGLTTILEKSLGAVAKGGNSILQDVLHYAEPLKNKGFNFMDSPGYDPVSVTGQVASGANVICFTTGRGSCFGCKPVPSLKLSTNSAMFERMSEDMDINCGTIAEGKEKVEEVGQKIFELVVNTASGNKSKSEINGYGDEEFNPWQVGVVM